MFVNRKFSGRAQVVLSFFALSYAFWAGAGEASANQVTFHKGWKQRKTPYKPTWGPSLCHTGGTSGSVSRSGSVSKRNALRSSFATFPSGGSGGSKQNWRLSDDRMLKKLYEIHEIQLSLLENAGGLSRAERLEKIRKIRQNHSQISPVISATRNFPFPAQMGDMEGILTRIRGGRVKSEFSGEGKTDAELLREIQKIQVERFRNTLTRSKRKKRNSI